MLIASGAIFGLATTPAFGFGRLDVRGTVLTTEDAVRNAAAIQPGANLVSLTTEPIVTRLRELPSVRDASVRLALPNVIELSIVERRPIVIWEAGGTRYAVDDGGLLFADVTSDPTGATAAVPVVHDDRDGAASLGVRTVLDPVILDAATRLGSLTPIQVGSSARRLEVHVTDKNGFVLSTGSGGWTAIFGFYGRSQRTPELIPGQVQLLAKSLVGREAKIESIVLADETDGTWVLKPSANPSPTPRP